MCDGAVVVGQHLVCFSKLGMAATIWCSDDERSLRAVHMKLDLSPHLLEQVCGTSSRLWAATAQHLLSLRIDAAQAPSIELQDLSDAQ